MEKQLLTKEELIEKINKDFSDEDLKKILIETIENIFYDRINWITFLFEGVLFQPFSAHASLSQGEIIELWDLGVIEVMKSIDILSNEKDEHYEVFIVSPLAGVTEKSSINPRAYGKILYFTSIGEAEKYAEAYKRLSGIQKIKIYKSEEVKQIG